jgi:membrane protease YdiL (CAAX protease family)
MQISDAILTLVFSATVAGAFVTWMVLGVRLSNRERLLAYEPRRPVPWDGFDVLAAIAIFIIAQFACLSLAVNLFDATWPQDRKHASPQFELAAFTGNLAASVVTLCGCLALLKFRAGATLTDLGFDLRKVPHDLKTGLVAFVAAAPVVYGIQVVLVQVIGIKYDHPLINAVEDRPSGLIVWIAVISAVVVAPILEEFLFRVLLQGWLEKLQLRRSKAVANLFTELPPVPSPEGTLLAPAESAIAPDGKDLEIAGEPPKYSLITAPVLISSTLFALVHWGQGAAPIPLFFLGLVLGYLYQQTHRALPSITVHMLLNGVSMLMFFLAPNGKPPA